MYYLLHGVVWQTNHFCCAALQHTLLFGSSWDIAMLLNVTCSGMLKGNLGTKCVWFLSFDFLPLPYACWFMVTALL